MKTAFVKPAPGLKIRRPDRLAEHLPEDGALVVLDDYWRARLRDGDVVAASPAVKPHAAKAAAKKES
jgi:hypothetical protein